MVQLPNCSPCFQDNRSSDVQYLKIQSWVPCPILSCLLVDNTLLGRAPFSVICPFQPFHIPVLKIQSLSEVLFIDFLEFPQIDFSQVHARYSLNLPRLSNFVKNCFRTHGAEGVCENQSLEFGYAPSSSTLRNRTKFKNKKRKGSLYPIESVVSVSLVRAATWTCLLYSAIRHFVC